MASTGPFVSSGQSLKGDGAALIPQPNTSAMISAPLSWAVSSDSRRIIPAPSP